MRVVLVTILPPRSRLALPLPEELLESWWESIMWVPVDLQVGLGHRASRGQKWCLEQA